MIHRGSRMAVMRKNAPVRLRDEDPLLLLISQQQIKAA